MALIATTFTGQRERVRALALFSAVSTGGFAIGLIIGGLLTEWLSWRAVLFINVPFGAAIVALVPKFVPSPARRPARLDLPGALTGTIGVAALVYTFIRAATSGWGDAVVLVTLAAGLLLLAAFVVIEQRARQPLVPLRLFADRDRAAAYANFFFGPMAMMSMFFFLTQYLQEVSHFAALGTGFAFLPMAAALFAMTRLIPKLLARFGPKPLTLVGTSLMIVGLAWLTRLSPDSEYLTGLFWPMLLMGLGGGLAFSPLNIIIMSTVRPEETGAAGGVLQTLQQVGGTLGLAILVTVFGTSARHAAEAGASPENVLVSGMTDAFVTSAAIATLTFLVALTFRKIRASGRP
jgi:MFS family permease